MVEPDSDPELSNRIRVYAILPKGSIPTRDSRAFNPRSNNDGAEDDLEEFPTERERA